MFNQKTSYGLAVLSGILLLLSFPPFNLGGFLAWIAFVPLLIAVWREENLKRMGRLTLVAGLCLIPVWSWLYYEFSWLLPPISSWLGLLCGIFIAGELYTEAVKEYWTPKNRPSGSLIYLPSGLQIIILPVFFTCGWFLMLNIPVIMKFTGALGFGSLAKTQWLNVPVIQMASFTGMYGITFLILLVNCAIAYGIIYYQEHRKVFKPSILAILIFVLMLGWGWLSIPKPVTGDVTIVIIQAPPPEKGNIRDLYVNLSKEATRFNPKAIVWTQWMMKGPSVNREQFASLSKETDNHFIGLSEGFGLSVASPDGETGYSPCAYHYVNLVDEVIHSKWNKLLFPNIQPLDTEFGRVGPLMCMESSPTVPARQLANNEVQLLTILTGSLGFSFPGEIGGNAVYRAVENRKPVVLACPRGSLIVDPYGRIMNDISTQDMVVGRISTSYEATFYTKYGDVFGWSIVGFAAILMIYDFYLKRRSPFMYCERCKAQIAKEVEICPECGRIPKESAWEKSDMGKLWRTISRK